MKEPVAGRDLLWVKRACRWALGIVWIWEGLFPKLLMLSPEEYAMFETSGLYWPTVEATLITMGIAEILAGLWLLSGWNERPAVVLTTVAVLILSAAAVALDPSSLIRLYGGIIKHLALFACGYAVWVLAVVEKNERTHVVGATGARRSS